MMHPFLAGFVDELTKEAGSSDGALLRRSLSGKDDPTAQEIVSTSIRNPVQNYMKTMLLGAVAAPAMTMLSRRVGRFVHNRDVMRAAARAVGAESKDQILSTLKTGRWIGSSAGHSPFTTPSMSHADLASDITNGVIGGSVIQAIRDKILNR